MGVSATTPGYDCVAIGHNEPPFEDYEQLVRRYGIRSAAYRDLKMSFVQVGEKQLTYVDLLNYALEENGQETSQPYLSGDMPHLASAYLTHFLRKRGFSATYVSLFQREKDTLRALLEANPLCVAITTTLYVLTFPVSEIVEFVRSCNPDVKIIVGGPLIANHARLRRQQGEACDSDDESPFHAMLDDIGADIYVVESQGELTLSRIVDCLKRRQDLVGVPNLVYRSGGSYVETAAVPENNDLNEADIDWRQSLPRPLGPTLQTRTARSCAFKCSFCNYPARAGKLTLASIETVVRELDSMYDLGDVRNVIFIDDTFNVPLDRFKALCRTMIERRYGFSWFSYFRCSNSDEEAIDLMQRSGCKGVFLGIESGSRVILENMNKAATVEKYETGIRMLREHGIVTFASFIVGFPGETAETVRETSEFVRRTRPDYYRAQAWYCEPETPIDHQREKFQISGAGFAWSHRTMTSSEAMDHLETMFLTIDESEWLPQWSFDFWILPYLLGRGMSFGDIREFVASANKLLRLEFQRVQGAEKRALQLQLFERLKSESRHWGAKTPETIELRRLTS